MCLCITVCRPSVLGRLAAEEKAGRRDMPLSISVVNRLSYCFSVSRIWYTGPSGTRIARLAVFFSPSPPLRRTEVSPPGLTTSLSFCCRGKHLRPLVTSTARWLTHVLCKNFCVCIRMSLCQSDNCINQFFYWRNRHCADSVYGITLFLRLIRHCLQLLVDNSDINTVRNYRRLMGHTQEINKVAIFLAYFPKMKVGLSNHLSVCVSVSPTNNFWTAWYIFMTFGMEVMPFKGTSMQYF
jgi:hypothetical protein